jgi:predicted Zn-dependent protease
VNGRSLLDLGEIGEADRVFSFLLNAEPDNADGHRGLAAVAYELGQHGRAAAHLNQVVRLDPGDARPHRLLAEIRQEQGKTEEAVNEYREALRLGTGLSAAARAEARFELALGLIELRRFADALAVLDDPAADPVEPPYIQGVRVEALRGLGRPGDAAALVERAMAAHPDGVFDRMRGQLYLDAGDASRAIPLLERAARLSPNHYQSHFVLAQAYSAVGRKVEADRADARAEEIRRTNDEMTSITREIAARPWDPDVRLRMAELCARTGDVKGATHWRRAATACRAGAR